MLGQLPGVSFNSSDPLALDPYSANIYMRGFTEDQLGFTLDGVPLGAQGYGSSGQGYGNIGGININSAIIGDNIERVNVSQGAGPVDVPSASNLGGVIQFISLDPTEAANWKTAAYIHHKAFAGYYTSPYYPSPDGAPLSEEEFASYSRRLGVSSDLAYRWNQHSLEAGLWYEHLHAYVPENLYSEPMLGEGAPLNPLGDVPTPYATPWAYTYSDTTKQAHLQDTYQVTPGLRLNAGFRSLFFTGTSGIAQNEPAYSGYTSLPSGSISASNAFLPQISGNWTITPDQEVFFNVSKNMRVFSQSGLEEGSPWGVASQALFNQLQRTLKPEQDFVYETGYRYTSSLVVGSLTLYHVDFSNRLQAIAVGPLADIQATIANVGDVKMNGLDANWIIRPIDSLSFSNSISLNSAKYQSDLTTGGTTYDLRDKQEVNYPEVMFKTRVTYTYGNLSAHLDGQYMGRRYISYDNDNYAPGYWVSNAGVSERVDLGGFLKNLTVGLNVYNLFDSTYISITGETGNPLSGDYQTFQIGAPRMVYGSLSAAF